MIFEVWFNQIRYSNEKMKALLSIVKEAPPEDSFMFIVTKDQDDSLREYIRVAGLMGIVKVQTPFLTNKVHEGSGRNMKIYILSNGKVEKRVQAAPKKRVSQLKLF